MNSIMKMKPLPYSHFQGNYVFTVNFSIVCQMCLFPLFKIKSRYSTTGGRDSNLTSISSGSMSDLNHSFNILNLCLLINKHFLYIFYPL